MNLDHELYGVGNSQHPSNEPETHSEEEKDLTIREAYETGHEDLILEAIGRQETKDSSIYSEFVFIRDLASQLGNTYLKNRITKFLKTLE